MKAYKYLAIPLVAGMVLLLVLYFHLGSQEVKIAEELPQVVKKKALNEVTGYFLPIPREFPSDQEKVALGKKLFNDPILSKGNLFACRNCHYLDKGGTDQLRYSPTISGGLRSRNTLSIFNVGLVESLNWDGSFSSLEAQVDALIKSSQAMASNWEEVLTKLNQDENYVRAFNRLYPEGMKPEAIKDAIAAYQRSLLTPDCALDRFLRGDNKALSAEAKNGVSLFQSLGCVSCHQGVNLGTNLFTSFGIFGDYFADRGNITKADFGRYNVTGQEEDKFVFRVSGLRNVVLTFPYFHDGTAQTLDKAVEIMARYQLGRELREENVADLVAFFESLTGTIEGKPL